MRKKNTTTDLTMDYISQSLFLIMKKKSFDDISIGEITEKAGVNRSTYYRNFKSKEDIARFYIDKILYDYKLVFNDTMSYKNHIKKMFNHYLAYKNELLSLYKNGLSYIILDVINTSFLKIFENKAISFEEKYRVYWNTGGIYNTFLLWLSDGMKESPEKMSEIYDKIISDNEHEFLVQPFLNLSFGR
jgi:AcrR family transcriptional regulator